MSGPRTSIRRELTVLGVASSGVALFLACASFLAFEVISYRKTLTNDVTTAARVLAFNLTAPLLFDDRSAADATLSALDADPRVVAVTVRREDGSTFASYLRPQAAARLGAEDRPAIGRRFEEDRLLITVPVISEAATVGTLTIEASLEERTQRMIRYLVLTTAVLAVALLAALLLATWLQRRILQPVMRLTELATQVSIHKDYSIRAEATREDELGVLEKTFNHMLAEIEQQSGALQRSVRMRDEFLAVASHELKTPLTPLFLQVQQLAREATRHQASFVIDRTRAVDRQLARLARLVDSLLDITRLANRKMELIPEEVDLGELVLDLVARFSDEAARTGSTLTVSALAPVVGRWDRMRVDQVLTNLISNAIKYGDGTPIEMWVEARDGIGSFAIQDHGIGIREEDCGRIFGRFERAVSDRHFGGFGLGLWIVREILDAMGGTIRVESRLGEGARFTVELPLEVPARPDAERGSQAQHVGPLS